MQNEKIYKLKRGAIKIKSLWNFPTLFLIKKGTVTGVFWYLIYFMDKQTFGQVFKDFNTDKVLGTFLII